MYPYGYNISMEVRKTEVFSKWIDGLKDIKARIKVLVRIERLTEGNPGDVKSVAKGLSELRISYGPGYRVYFTKKNKELIILLAGGDKSSQVKDIKKAIKLLENL